MIDDKQIEWYFNWMKSKGVISEGWIYDGFNIRGDKIVIRYFHRTRERDKYISKNSSYAFSKDKVLTDIREAKLRQLFD